MDSVLEVLAGYCLRGVAFWRRCLQLFWRGVVFFACSVLEGCGIFGGCFSVLEGCGIFGECFRGVTFRKRRLQSFGGVWHFWRALAVFWRGCGIFGGHLHILEGCLQYFGGVWHFWRALVVFACSVLEVRDILEEALAVFWRGVAFLEGACRVLEGCGIFLRGACSVLEGHDILEEVLGGVWHFWSACVWRRCCIFGGVWHYWRGACSVLEGA